jgi:hypothetical protein
MKKLIPLIILIGGAVSGFSQGSVTFRNSPTFATVDPVSATGNRLVYDQGSPLDVATGVGLVGTQYVAELYAGASAGSLAPVTASISRFRGTTTASKGKWGLQTVNAVANDPMVMPSNDFGTTAFLQVVVWDYDANGGAAGSFGTASGKKGSSNIFTYKVPAAGDLLLSDFVMEGLGSFALVPEPSAIALSVLGIAGLLFVRRRK